MYLSASLTTGITDRKKQYSTYVNKLLTKAEFLQQAEMLTLNESTIQGQWLISFLFITINDLLVWIFEMSELMQHLQVQQWKPPPHFALTFGQLSSLGQLVQEVLIPCYVTQS